MSKNNHHFKNYLKSLGAISLISYKTIFHSFPIYSVIFVCLLNYYDFEKSSTNNNIHSLNSVEKVLSYANVKTILCYSACLLVANIIIILTSLSSSNIDNYSYFMKLLQNYIKYSINIATMFISLFALLISMKPANNSVYFISIIYLSPFLLGLPYLLTIYSFSPIPTNYNNYIALKDMSKEQDINNYINRYHPMTFKIKLLIHIILIIICLSIMGAIANGV